MRPIFFKSFAFDQHCSHEIQSIWEFADSPLSILYRAADPGRFVLLPLEASKGLLRLYALFLSMVAVLGLILPVAPLPLDVNFISRLRK